jgi:hypothetical protein
MIMIDVNAASATIAEKATQASNVFFNPTFLILGIVFIIVAIIVLYFLKNILLNSVMGVFGFLICYFIFGIKLPFFITLIISAIFGIGGLGAVIVLKFFGLI